MQEFVSLANSMADIAGKIIKKYYRTSFVIDHKRDDSPVTMADREIETALRDIIQRTRPDDGFLGEEFEPVKSKNGLTWVVDPIDGTKSFIVGRPTFGTLIALCEEGIPKLGIIDQAILKERWVGIEGKQTTLNDEPVSTRKCPDFQNAIFGATSPNMFNHVEDFGQAYEIFETTGNKFVWGGDCYMYGLLASGFVDVVFEENLSPYDFLALAPIVKGAGGHISNWRGEELTINSISKVVAVGDRELWPTIEKKIRKSPY